MLTTTLVTFCGDDEAVCDSCFLFVDESQTPPALRSSGRYHDTVRRDDGEWKLAVREIILDS
jgi:hypothetical protein